ncbi:MAG: DUF559 domain-containing protein [Bacteroidaceae bacterium]|nr:DUF559 domain-containing protein [Bacteroidaceae bacterium]
MHPPHTHNINSKKGMRTYLRTHGTIAEIIMWRLLKSRQIDGVKFRRQFSVDNYILDFYCPELRLCIELDGTPHFTEAGRLRDKCRTKDLREIHYIQTLRFENEMVLKYTEWVRSKIVEAVGLCRLGRSIEDMIINPYILD